MNKRLRNAWFWFVYQWIKSPLLVPFFIGFVIANIMGHIVGTSAADVVLTLAILLVTNITIGSLVRQTVDFLRGERDKHAKANPESKPEEKSEEEPKAH